MFRKGFENGLPPADHQSKQKTATPVVFISPLMFPRTRSGDRAILSFILGPKGPQLHRWRGGGVQQPSGNLEQAGLNTNKP